MLHGVTNLQYDFDPNANDCQRNDSDIFVPHPVGQPRKVNSGGRGVGNCCPKHNYGMQASEKKKRALLKLGIDRQRVLKAKFEGRHASLMAYKWKSDFTEFRRKGEGRGIAFPPVCPDSCSHVD